MIPRCSIISSISRKLSEKRWYSQTQWLVISAGNPNPCRTAHRRSPNLLISVSNPSIISAPDHQVDSARQPQVSQIFHHSTRPHLNELDLSRTLELAAAIFGDGDEQTIVRFPRGSSVIPNRQRLAAVAVMSQWEPRLSPAQRLAVVDAAAWWLSEPNVDEGFTYALYVNQIALAVNAKTSSVQTITVRHTPRRPHPFFEAQRPFRRLQKLLECYEA